MRSVTIRPARLEDAADISRLICILAKRCILPEFSSDGREKFLAEHTPEAMRRRFESGFDYHLAVNGGELLGLVGIRDRSHLFHLFVAEGEQGQGLGRMLWRHALERCDWASSEVTVNSSRNAVPVYERFGFKVCAPEQNTGGIRFVPMKLDLTVNRP